LLGRLLGRLFGRLLGRELGRVGGRLRGVVTSGIWSDGEVELVGLIVTRVVQIPEEVVAMAGALADTDRMEAVRADGALPV
jgi:hypothetical protein